MRRFTLCLLAALLGGCSAPSVSPAPHGKTLGQTSAIPIREIERLYTPENWQWLLQREYSGYVVLDGQVRADGRIAVRQVRTAVPDAKRNMTALLLCTDIQTMTDAVGSRTPVQAEIFVVFFETPFREALIFARQNESTAPVARTSGVIHVATKSY